MTRYYTFEHKAMIENAVAHDKEQKFNIAFMRAAQQRLKESERSIIDIYALAPDYLALITHFDFTFDQADELLKKLDAVQRALVPHVTKYMNNYLNAQIPQLTTDDVNIFEEAFSDSSYFACCVHFDVWLGPELRNNFTLTTIPDTVANVSESILKSASEDLMVKIMNSKGFIFEIQNRVILRVKELNKGLSKDDPRYHELYEDEIKTALARRYSLNALSTEANNTKLQKAEESIATITRLSSHSEKSSSDFDPVYLMLKVGLAGTLLLSFVLLCTRVKSLARLDLGLTRAIKAGITFMKGNDDKPAVATSNKYRPLKVIVEQHGNDDGYNSDYGSPRNNRS